MRQVVCRQLGQPAGLVVEDAAPPRAGPGQVVIDVRACGVNYVDALLVGGGYQIKPPVPFVPGTEVAGVVSEIGPGVEGLEVSVGDPVMATSGLGGFAEQVAVAAGSVAPLPAGFDLARAASFTQSYCTALFALARRTTVDPGETVLVLGAGGGLGLASVDVAHALGARVVAAASSAAKLAAATAAGAEAGIDYEAEDLKVRARELTGGGVDVVADPVGGPYAEPALRATRLGGRYLVLGFTAGIASVPLNQILLNNRSVMGVEWGAWAARHPDDNRALLDELLGLVSAGRLSPAQPQAFPLEEAGQLLTAFLERRITGKVVLVP